MKGTETALYDFGKEGTFRTTISYVVEHNNDPSKFYLNAVEMIVPGSGTGRFVRATGTITDHDDLLAFPIRKQWTGGPSLLRTEPFAEQVRPRYRHQQARCRLRHFFSGPSCVEIVLIPRSCRDWRRARSYQAAPPGVRR